MKRMAASLIGTVTDLDRRTVLDECGHVFPDPSLDIGDFELFKLKNGVIDFDGIINVRDVNERSPVRYRHIWIDLCKDKSAGALENRKDIIHGDPQATVAVSIRGRYGKHENIALEISCSEQVRIAAKDTE